MSQQEIPITCCSLQFQGEQLVLFIHCRAETDLWVRQMIFMADCYSMKYEYRYIELTMWGSHEPKLNFCQLARKHTPPTQITIKYLQHGLFVLYAQYSTRSEVARPIKHTASPRAVLVSRPHPSYYIEHTALQTML